MVAEHRPEHLFLRQDVSRRNAGRERRQIEIAARRQRKVRLPAFGALPGALGHQPAHAVELGAVDQRADVGVLVERAADAQPAHARLDLGDEGVGDALLHQQPRAGAADLALVEPDAVDQPFDGAVEIGVLEDDEGRLAAELQRQFLAGAGGRLADDLADFGRAGEGDLVDAGMIDDRSTRAGTARQDVDDALRHAGALADLGEQDRRQRREFGGLQHDRAARRPAPARSSRRASAAENSTG